MSRRPWNSLSDLEIAVRLRALDLRRQLLRGATFTTTAKHIGISPKTAKSHLRGYLVKRKGRWHAKKEDHIERGINIYSNGRIRTVIINSSSTASLLGHHSNDIKFVLSSRMSLDVFEGKYKDVIITDKDGKKFKLEVRLNKLKEIELRKESSPINDDHYAHKRGY